MTYRGLFHRRASAPGRSDRAQAEGERLRVWLLGLGPLLAVVLSALYQTADQALGLQAAAALAALVGCVLLAGWLAGLNRAAARALGTVGLLGASLLAAAVLTGRPALALGLALVVVALLFRLWSVGTTPRLDGEPSHGPRATRLVVSSGLALLAWLVVPVAELAKGLLAEGATAASLLLAAGYAARVALGRRQRSGIRMSSIAGAVLVVAAAAVAVAVSLRAGLLLGGLGPAAWLAIALARAGTRTVGAPLDLVLHHPARLLVVTFVVLCTFGTLLLALPASASRGGGIGLLDAAFTAVSAVCVTGLVVRDTAAEFSAFGQVGIVLLIQAGGLGIMTISTAAMGLLGRRLSLRHEGAMAELVSSENRGELFRALRRTMLVTLGFEGTGAALLAWLFRAAGDDPGRALWRGVFTSVSAFCNAGFALQSDSLVAYQHQPGVLHVVALLIVAGGLSPAVIVVLPRLVRRKRLGLQAKIVLATSAALLLLGFGAVLALEWNSSLASLSPLERLHNAWFQSVTTRTAGFNSVDLGQVRPATAMVMMLLMFVGGCPGGTAGGIKTTTAFVLVLAIAGSLRGRAEAIAFGRRIQLTTVFKASAIVTLGLLTAVAAVLAIQITQTLAFDVAVFEVVSAIGTVGLTLGGTARLDQVGKVIIMLCMFLGRVGPLTAFFMLSDRRIEPAWEYPEEQLEVG